MRRYATVGGSIRYQDIWNIVKTQYMFCIISLRLICFVGCALDIFSIDTCSNILYKHHLRYAVGGTPTRVHSIDIRENLRNVGKLMIFVNGAMLEIRRYVPNHIFTVNLFCELCVGYVIN